MQKIIIIGAGIAGMSAAVSLAKAGYRVSLYETKNQTGGRVYSFRDNVTGEMIDNGQHALSGAYQNFFSLLNDLGTFKYLNFQKSLEVFFSEPDKKLINFNTGKLPGVAGTVYGFLALKGISASSKLRIIKLLYSIKSGKLNVSNQTCLEFLKSNNQDDQIITRFWNPLILATLNSSSSHAPAQLLINILKLSFFANPEFSKLLLPTVELSNLLEPFTNWLKENNGEIFYNSRVESFILSEDKITGIKLTDGSIINADVVITTVPPSILDKLIDSGNNIHFGYLPEFGNSTIVNIYYWLDTYIETPDFVSMLNTSAQWMFNRSKFMLRDKEMKAKYPGLINITISDAEQLKSDNNDLITLCWNELKACIPDFEKCNILRAKIISDKSATFNVNLRTELLRPESKTGIRNLFLAGDWTNTGLPATIEGASKSGATAANEVMSYLKNINM